MSKPIIGNNSQECIHCGKWYGDGMKECVHCKEPNPDYKDKSDRFRPHQYSRSVAAFEMVEGVMVRVKNEDN